MQSLHLTHCLVGQNSQNTHAIFLFWNSISKQCSIRRRRTFQTSFQPAPQDTCTRCKSIIVTRLLLKKIRKNGRTWRFCNADSLQLPADDTNEHWHNHYAILEISQTAPTETSRNATNVEDICLSIPGISQTWCHVWHMSFHFIMEISAWMGQNSSVPWCRVWHVIFHFIMENST